MEEWSALQLLLYGLMLIELVAIAVIDMKHKTINPQLLVLMFAGGLITTFTCSRTNLWEGILAMLLVFAALGAVYFLARKSIGWGDVKLCACIALYLGIEGAFSMLAVSMVLCGLTGVVLLVINKSGKNIAIPYAPFAALGTAAVLLL